MSKPIVIYDEARGKILAKYVENFGKFCEVDVTDQTLQAVFRYLMAYGLTLNENYEYEFDGDRFSNSLVKQEAPTVVPVKCGKWEKMPRLCRWWKCTQCNHIINRVVLPHYCECCGSKNIM